MEPVNSGPRFFLPPLLLRYKIIPRLFRFPRCPCFADLRFKAAPSPLPPLKPARRRLRFSLLRHLRPGRVVADPARCFRFRSRSTFAIAIPTTPLLPPPPVCFRRFVARELWTACLLSSVCRSPLGGRRQGLSGAALFSCAQAGAGRRGVVRLLFTAMPWAGGRWTQATPQCGSGFHWWDRSGDDGPHFP